MNAPVSSKHDVATALRQHRDAIRGLGVKRLGLFGSFVRGQQRPDSDVDLLVEFEPAQKTFDHFMALCFLLEEVLRRRVELVTSESLSPYIRPHVLEEVEDVTLAA
jgi:predicted nucleotidyltransferase